MLSLIDRRSVPVGQWMRATSHHSLVVRRGLLGYSKRQAALLEDADGDVGGAELLAPVVDADRVPGAGRGVVHVDVLGARAVGVVDVELGPPGVPEGLAVLEVVVVGLLEPAADGHLEQVEVDVGARQVARVGVLGVVPDELDVDASRSGVTTTTTRACRS
jgi:hypothetical protein